LELFLRLGASGGGRRQAGNRINLLTPSQQTGGGDTRAGISKVLASQPGFLLLPKHPYKGHSIKKEKSVMEKLTHDDVRHLATKTSQAIIQRNAGFKAFPIPWRGVPAAYAVTGQDPRIQLVNDPWEADFFINDVIDHPATAQHCCTVYPEKSLFALIDKTQKGTQWAHTDVVFPWENHVQEKAPREEEPRETASCVVDAILKRLQEANAPFCANDNIAAFIGEGELHLLQAELMKRAEYFLRGLVLDLDRDHNMVETASRMAKMYLQEIFKGRYLPAPKITSFPNAQGLRELYTAGPITVRSACSHHFVPFFGSCWIGIVPGERVIGLSKFNRIVDWIASRPQIQEELVVQIADFIEAHLPVEGLAVAIEATHMCMTWRGVKEPLSAKMTTQVMRGVFRDQPEIRSAFMNLVAKG